MAWIEEKFVGSPGAVSKGNIDDIFASTPDVSNVSKIDFGDLPGGYTYRWKQSFNLPQGHYRFTVTTDDGMRVYVNNVIKIDAWKDQPPTTYNTNVSVKSNEPTLITVEYYNDRGLGVAKFSYAPITEAEDPIATPQPVPEPIPTPTLPPAVTQPTVPQPTLVDLKNIVEFSKMYTERTYTKGTLATIQDDELSIKNNSDTITVTVSFTPADGISFVPNTVTLLPNKTSVVKIKMNSATINSFSEGITDLDCIISLSSNTLVTTPGSTTVTPPVIPPPPPPIIPPPVEPPVIPPPTQPPASLGVFSVTVTPSSAELNTGDRMVFSAIVQADAGVPHDVTWSVNKPLLAKISTFGILYVFDDPGILEVTATSTYDPTKKGTATVNVTKLPVVPEAPPTAPPTKVERPVLIDPNTGEVIVVQKGTDPVTISDSYLFTCNRVGEVTREFKDYNNGYTVTCTVHQDPEGGCIEVCRYSDVDKSRSYDFNRQYGTGDGYVDDNIIQGDILSVTKVENTSIVRRGKQMVDVDPTIY